MPTVDHMSKHRVYSRQQTMNDSCGLCSYSTDRVKFIAVTEPEDSLACSLKPDIGPYSQPVRHPFEILRTHGDEY
jgi:hypothetical protein